MLSVILAAAILIQPLGRTVQSNPFCGHDCDQCTNFVEEYVHHEFGFWMRVNGDAKAWANSARDSGWPVVSQPVIGGVLVMQPGLAGPAGHVAIIDQYMPDAVGGGVRGQWIHVLDRNWNDDGMDGAHWLLWTGDMQVIEVQP